MNRYNKEESKTVPMIINWLECEGLRFAQTLTHIEKKLRAI